MKSTFLQVDLVFYKKAITSCSIPILILFLLFTCHPIFLLVTLLCSPCCRTLRCQNSTQNMKFSFCFFFLIFSSTLSFMFFSPTCFVLLICYRDTINSHHSVSESAHQRTAGPKCSRLWISQILQPKEKCPSGLQLLYMCVQKGYRTKHSRGKKTRVMANLNHRYFSDFFLLWEKLTASSSHLMKVMLRIFGFLSARDPEILQNPK